MKIFLLVTKSETVLTFRQCLIRHLLEQGHAVHVIAYDDDCRHEIRQLGVAFASVRQENRWLNPFAIVQYALQVRKLLKQAQPDLVFTFQLKPNTFGVLAAKSAGIKQIFSMVEGAGDVFIQNTLKWKLIRLVACALYRIALQHARKVFFLNQEDKQEFVSRQLVAEEKCRVIPGVGVDLVHFAETPVTGHRSFLMLARMLKTKGVEDYCKCARLVRQKYPDAEFSYLGAEGTVRIADIQSYIDDGSVRYLGTTRDVRPYLRDCTALLLPSYREGMPMSVMEAAASGRCVITTRSIGCKDAVKDGETGFLVPVSDPEAMAEKCIYLIEHPETAQAMGAAARQFAQKTFDEQAINSYLLQELEREENL